LYRGEGKKRRYNTKAERNAARKIDRGGTKMQDDEG
jgi:hypothetical protein